MKTLPLLMLPLLAACKVPPPPLEPVAFTALPEQTCRVTDFIADSDNQRFIQGNLAKRFNIRSTQTGFFVTTSSPAFTSGTMQFVVTSVDVTRLNATEESILRDQIDTTMTIDRDASSGQRSAQVTSTVLATSSTNVWTLSCRDAR